MKTQGFDHLNLSVESFEETANWYEKVFGFEVVEKGLYDGEPWGVLRCGNAMLCVYESPGKVLLRQDNPEHAQFHRIYHFGLRVSDRETWEEQINRLEIKTYFDSPVQYPHSKSWYVKDPTGYTIEVTLWEENRVRF